MSLFSVSSALKNTAEPTLVQPEAKWVENCLVSEKRFGAVSHAIGVLQKNAVLNFWTDNQFSNHELLYFLLNQTGPAEVYIACWTISEKVGRVINSMQEQLLITQLWGILDNTSRSRHPADFHYSKNLFSRLAMADIHAKVCVIKNENWLISFFGSANFTTNHRIERGMICTVESTAQDDLVFIINQMNKGERVVWN